MNKYEHVIAFEKADGTDTSYYTLKEYHDSLQAKKGDIWRWLAPKSVSQGIDVRNLSIALIKPNYIPSCGDPVQENAIRYQIGRIRHQESERYVEFTIWIGGLPSEGDWKQFALQRANGEKVIGTFKGQHTTKAEYMKALKYFYESFPYTKVWCDVDQSKMRVRIWEKQGVFMLADEGLTVGLGATNVSNTNNPQISKIPQGSHTYPNRDSYKLVIGSNVQEGNKFTLGTKVYFAKSGDTAQDILEHFIATGDRYIVTEGSPVALNAENGTRTITNTNNLVVQAVFASVSGGNDRYHIRVSGSPQPGNVVQVSATGKTTKSFTVATGNSTDDIEDFFNTDSGDYYTVSSGVIPQVSFLAGNQVVINANGPSIALTDLTGIASFVVDRYQIIIGSDVETGNIFVLGDKSYMATDGDTDLLVAESFGFDSVSFSVEVPTGEPLEAYALKGLLYNENNIADVTITDGPKLARSSQHVFEAEFNCDIENGVYRLGIIDTRPEVPELIAIGNYIIVRDKAEGELFEVADRGDVFGFEYYENGLTQRMRLPVFVNPPAQQSEEERIVKFQGGYGRTATKREFVSEMITRAARLPMHVTIASFLKHNHLRIGEKLYYNEGEYAESHLVPGTDLRQATAKITELSREKNNFSRYRSTYYQSGEYGGFVLVQGDGIFGRLQLFLTSLEIVRELKDISYVNAASYQVSAETFEDLILSIYRNGTHVITALLPKHQRIRLQNWFRLETGSVWVIKAELSGACIETPEITYSHETVSGLEITYEHEVGEKPAYGDFSDDFSQDFTNG
jgi:hypothetical protein